MLGAGPQHDLLKTVLPVIDVTSLEDKARGGGQPQLEGALRRERGLGIGDHLGEEAVGLP
ncbi:hypothetical protein PLESTB_000597000 [Pleodorina starrii]|uniref:Uncharacterized protein n=1 Tax=Pleodorina starrii TaxID=330485 RepID=A0A9W6BHM3_9CHLO|nr:hypothetical protein PLESTB_000597000 [Pleodorina starrii]